MVEITQSLLNGFAIALKPIYFYYALIGTILGTITGVLPGLGPLGAMAILLSFTFTMDATGAMILFAGIYYGAMYGGSTTSILLNIPGEAASVVTCIDGYKMAQKGRAGAALAVSAVGSFIAGTISILGLMVAALFLSDIALRFGPPEFFAIGVCGLILLMRLSGGSLLKAFIMILVGMALSTVGVDFLTGIERFTYGIQDLGQGIEFLPVAMGLFGIAEVLITAEQKEFSHPVQKVKLRELLPTRREWKRSIPPMFRGSFLGFIIGLVPGPSPVIATFVSYISEKKISKNPEEFGHGAIEGVAGPEAANNAAVGGAYVPLFALGIPFTPAMAMVLGALMLHGLTPGPNLIKDKPDLFWAVIASMYIGNFMLLILNLPLVNVFVNILKVPKHILLPVIVLICLIGVYTVNASPLDLLVLAVFGFIGYALRGVGFQPAPLILAMVIGPMLETSLRQSLNITGGNMGAVIFRPICLTLYIIVALTFVIPLVLKFIRKSRHPKRSEFNEKTMDV
ncbi:MAG: tripartite tricarboxylate transporter permease [Deltaproteobacteria bacterium]|nr:tripartite tricarboxylate transporter permease [Deltaproteobacteria bacterium]